MTTKITVVLEDDLDGGPADETVRFGIDGTGYEIDLSTTNAAAFRRQLAPYIDHARRVGTRVRQRPGRIAASRARSTGTPKSARRGAPCEAARVRSTVCARPPAPAQPYWPAQGQMALYESGSISTTPPVSTRSATHCKLTRAQLKL
jgi:hypothetical protein